MTESAQEITGLTAAVEVGAPGYVTASGTELVDMARAAASRAPFLLASGARKDADGDDIADLALLVLDGGQSIKEIDLAAYLPPLPRLARGSVSAKDAASFVAYVARHRRADSTTFWSDPDAAKITAIFDDWPISEAGTMHGPTDGYAQHRVVLTMKPTPDWIAWTERNDVLMTQEQFAEFLEDNAALIRKPNPATFIAIARTFTAKTGAAFAAGFHTESGAVKFAYEETVNARAGQKGEVDIPAEFEIAIQPFEGSQHYPVAARFKYRMKSTGLELGYRLIRPDLIRAEAFSIAESEIAAELGAEAVIMTASPGR